MSEYQVILDDLKDLYKAFYNEERTLDQQRHNVNFAAPDCGEAKVNKACREALDTVNTLYQLLTKQVESDGDKIKHAHDGYSRDNQDVLALFNELEG
ncbi:DUF6317 family protein [Streptomyces sp. NPDC001537]